MSTYLLCATTLFFYRERQHSNHSLPLLILFTSYLYRTLFFLPITNHLLFHQYQSIYIPVLRMVFYYYDWKSILPRCPEYIDPA